MRQSLLADVMHRHGIHVSFGNFDEKTDRRIVLHAQIANAGLSLFPLLELLQPHLRIRLCRPQVVQRCIVTGANVSAVA